eukprot:scaffold3870_cov323-Prasinococcus_capsulatus_cf.AAC.1
MCVVVVVWRRVASWRGARAQGRRGGAVRGGGGVRGAAAAARGGHGAAGAEPSLARPALPVPAHRPGKVPPRGARLPRPRAALAARRVVSVSARRAAPPRGGGGGTLPVPALAPALAPVLVLALVLLLTLALARAPRLRRRGGGGGGVGGGGGAARGALLPEGDGDGVEHGGGGEGAHALRAGHEAVDGRVGRQPRRHVAAVQAPPVPLHLQPRRAARQQLARAPLPRWRYGPTPSASRRPRMRQSTTIRGAVVGMAAFGGPGAYPAERGGRGRAAQEGHGEEEGGAPERREERGVERHLRRGGGRAVPGHRLVRPREPEVRHPPARAPQPQHQRRGTQGDAMQWAAWGARRTHRRPQRRCSARGAARAAAASRPARPPRRAAARRPVRSGRRRRSCRRPRA